jgi:hypothetical protein
MTLAAQRIKVGRRPFTYVEIDLDYCSNTYGTAPCVAAVGTTGARKCFNTLRTCQDGTHFTVGTTKTFRFCMDGQVLPGHVAAAFGAIPSISGITMEPARLDPSKGLGVRATTTINLRDHPHNDRGIDKYVATRPYDPLSQGTFWGRLLARNPYYEGRALRIYTGYLADDGSIDAANFTCQAFVLQKIDGPDAAGKITISAKDVLTLTDDSRVQFPAVSNAKLLADITDTATSFVLVANGADKLDAPAYPASNGYVTIDSEVIYYSSHTSAVSGGGGFISTFTVAPSGRGSKSTDAAAHTASSKVQNTIAYLSKPPRDVLTDLFTAAGVSSGYLDLTGWDAEIAQWLQGKVVSRVLSKPTGVRSLILELTESIGIYLWWDTRLQKVKMRAFRPSFPEDIIDLTDNANLIAGTVSRQVEFDKRITQVWVYFDALKPAEDPSKPEDFRQLYVAADGDAPKPEQYQSARVRTIFARWLNSNDAAFAAQLANRTLSAYRDPPVTVKIGLDPKDGAIWTGSDVQVISRLFQNEDGSPEPTLLRITEARDSIEGKPLTFTAQTTGYKKRYARIAPGTRSTAGATMPAVGASISLPVLWVRGFLPGSTYLMPGIGTFIFNSAPDSTHLSITNTGDGGNVAPGTAIPSGTSIRLRDYGQCTALERIKYGFIGRNEGNLGNNPPAQMSDGSEAYHVA